MGNKLCKKKVDAVDKPNVDSPTTLDRIINRLHLRPSSWKSDSQLNQKQANRCEISTAKPNDKANNIIHSQPLSKSSDWTEVDLEVPDHDEHIHLPNPKLAIIFNNENGTPTPPPRKHKRNFREKIEAVAKTGLQAFQSKKPVEEPICVKKKINYECPLCDQDETGHNRDHHHSHNHENLDKNRNEHKKEDKQNNIRLEKENIKRKKNLSVISLPNYDELKLTVANFDDIDKVPLSLKRSADKRTSSQISLHNDHKKPTSASTGKLDNYITRCRSFGSLFPQQLKKLRSRKAPADVESDDSFGGLEDWDLGLIEHYNPKDASLPRPRKVQRNSKDVMSDVESLIVQEEDMEKPKPPVRRSESLVKRINREAAQTAHKMSTELVAKEASKNPTPPPSPVLKKEERSFLTHLPTEENGHVEHSSLIKILEQFSMKDKQNEGLNKTIDKTEEIICKSTNDSDESSLTPSLMEFEKNIASNSVEDFINAEKINTDKDLSFVNFNKAIAT